MAGQKMQPKTKSIYARKDGSRKTESLPGQKTRGACKRNGPNSAALAPLLRPFCVTFRCDSGA